MGILMLLILAFFALLLLTEGPNMLRDWRRTGLPGPPEPGDVARLREEVDRLSGEVARLSEEQSFLLRLLTDEDRTPLPRPERAPRLRSGGLDEPPSREGPPQRGEQPPADHSPPP